MSRVKLLSAVKACLGTPFCHQGRTPKVGLDCIGLVVVGLKAAGVSVQDKLDYGVRPDGKSLVASLVKHKAYKVTEVQQGDVLVIRYDNQPQHVAVAISSDELIHSFAPAGRVVQSQISSYWRKRILSIYRFFESDGV